MLLTVNDLITLLRSSVNVQVPAVDGEGQETSIIDPAYLSMTDEDLTLFLKLGVSRAYPEVTDLEDLPDGAEYAVMLLAKIELYMKLAVLRTDDVDLGADNNNYIKQDQKFSHYMKLVEAAQQQYESWLDNEGEGGATGVTSFDVLLSNRHYTRRNIEKQMTPKVKLKIGDVTADSVEITYSVSNTSHFGRFKVYISKTPIVDMFAEGVAYSNKVSADAKLIKSTQNIRNIYHRVQGLEPSTDYYIAVFAIESNKVFGYAETSFTTLDVLEDEEELSEETW